MTSSSNFALKLLLRYLVKCNCILVVYNRDGADVTLRWQAVPHLRASNRKCSAAKRSAHLRHNFVKGLFRDNPSNLYWNQL